MTDTDEFPDLAVRRDSPPWAPPVVIRVVGLNEIDKMVKRTIAWKIAEDLRRKATEADEQAKRWAKEPHGECLAMLRLRDAATLRAYARKLEAGE